MSPEIQTLLITIALLSQIVVLSFVAPIRLRRFYSKLYVNYPEAKYPRFYPVPRAEMERNFRRYLMIRMATGPIGLAALVFGIVTGVDPQQLGRIMGGVLIVQMLSAIVAYRWRPGIPRAMSKLPPPPRRSAELRCWRITDFVSPALIALGLASVLSVFAVVAYVYVAGQGDGGIIGFAIFGAFPISIAYLAWMLLRIWKPVSPIRGESYPSQSDPFRQRQFLWTRLAISLLAQALFLVVPSLAFRAMRSLDFSGYRAACA